MLFLGAGASHSSTNRNGDPVPMGEELANIMSEASAVIIVESH
jgi:hypothetical protein